ncbi:MAG: RluA family pseudouridine synthase [Chloroflexi bacterium]|nr:RluA family pseudouridine synthase [Chloroflexota bacterium]
MSDFVEEDDELFDIDDEDAGERLDKFIAAALPALSRSEVQRLIKAEGIRVNDGPAKASYRLEAGDRIAMTLPDPPDHTVYAEDIPLEILYEDDALAAISKPAGMVVHPAYGHRQGTVVNAALTIWPQMRSVGESEERAGVVHRLDKDTSGVLVLAKTSAALMDLQAQFKARTVEKHYVTLVEGTPESSSGVIDAPIGRDPDQRKRMAVVHGGREAVTRFTLLEDLHTHALLDVEPHTGRTHQIRVHLAWLGNPVVGDRVYGYRKQRIKLKRLFLHAASLELDSPLTGERLRFEAPLPVGLQNIVDKLRR